MKLRSLLLPLAALVLLAVLPLFGGKFYVELVAKIMIMAIFAMSLDLLVGFTGLVSLGHAAFFGVASYTVALLSPRYEAASLWTTLPLAMGASALLALVVGALALRTRGVYFIMVTLAFAQMVYFVFHDTKLGGGSDGIYLYVKPEAKIADRVLLDFDNPIHFYYAMLVLLLAVFVFLRAVLASRFGHALKGIRSNEQRMRAVGFNTYAYKLAAFVLGGALAGLAGYFAAVQFGFVNPEILSWHQSGNALLMVILGGMGNLGGAIIGAFSFVLLQDLFSSLSKHWQLLLGGFIILAVALLPRGIVHAGSALQAFRGSRRNG
jgi:branched-chain amino acid transport system permease protein